jgi:hypothetical protein
MKKIAFLIFFYSIIATKLAQAQPYILRAVVENGDTIPIITLRPLVVSNSRTFKDRWAQARYDRLYRNVKIVYPYAKAAGKTIRMVDVNLGKITNARQKEIYLKQTESALMKEFEDDIRKMTFSQGKILIKLIDRETRYTSYELVKHYRGGISAFFWQGIARVFSADLKSDYDDQQDDRDIELIIQSIEGTAYSTPYQATGDN